MEQTHQFCEAFGQHLTIDGYGCSREALGDLLGIYDFLFRAPGEINMTRIMPPHVMEYRPPPGRSLEEWGISGFVIIAESHISVHTYPDRRYLSLDLFSCKPFNVAEATQMVIDQFGIARVEVNLLDRGLEFPRNQAMVEKYLLAERGDTVAINSKFESNKEDHHEKYS